MIKHCQIDVNGRCYAMPARPIVVICADGCADAYIDAVMVRDRAPNLSRMAREGARFQARAAVPTFTNVNNCAIVSGAGPSVTRLGGNYFLDPETGEEIMANDDRFLRCPTILSAAERAGRRVAMVTAKDKLRRLLGKDLEGPAFSAEKGAPATLGIGSALGPRPPIYSGDASVYVLRAGVALLEKGVADVLYLTLTDYIQHGYAADEPEAMAFLSALDHEIGRLLDLGAIVGITADHGMNDKCHEDGTPNVTHLESLLDEEFGPGCRVICPITDPYVAHHGALGSAVNVYVREGADVADVGRFIAACPGVAEVWTRDQADLLDLPDDRMGDLFVMSTRNAVLGRRPSDHDLSQLVGRLRSHGGRYEELVPMLLSHPLSDTYRIRSLTDPRNYDIFDFVCNGVVG